MSEVDASNNEATGHSASRQSTLGLISVALVLPVFSGVLLFFVTSIPLARGISAVTVVATAVLVAIDAKFRSHVIRNLILVSTLMLRSL